MAGALRNGGYAHDDGDGTIDGFNTDARACCPVDGPVLDPDPPSLAAWAAIAGLAILSTALAYLIFFRILASSGATNLMLVTFLIPVSAVLLGFLFLGEQLEPRHFAGMGLIPWACSHRRAAVGVPQAQGPHPLV